MINRVLRLDLDDAVAGMTLAHALHDAQGGVLLPQDTVLTEQMLTSLRRRGIDEISVVNDNISEAELAAERERLRQRLEVLFRKCGDRGASKLLLQSVMQYRLGIQT